MSIARSTCAGEIVRTLSRAYCAEELEGHVALVRRAVIVHADQDVGVKEGQAAHRSYSSARVSFFPRHFEQAFFGGFNDFLAGRDVAAAEPQSLIDGFLDPGWYNLLHA